VVLVRLVEAGLFLVGGFLGVAVSVFGSIAVCLGVGDGLGCSCPVAVARFAGLLEGGGLVVGLGLGLRALVALFAFAVPAVLAAVTAT